MKHFSLFDRLQHQPHSKSAMPSLEDSIRQQLERLLNTHCTYSEPSSLSLTHYGIRDFSHEALDQAAKQQQLAHYIKNVIGYFEPRLSQVNVHIYLESGKDSLAERYLHMDIEAIITRNHQPIATNFTSRLNQQHGEIRLSEVPHES